jgi:hypothetical protein
MEERLKPEILKQASLKEVLEQKVEMLKPRRNSTTEFTVNKIKPHSFYNLFKSDEVSGTDKESIITSIKEVNGPKDTEK